jgi:diguanylate cyclase (GGDEF)-like protein
VHPQQVTISAIRDRAGAVIRYLAVYADISELKQQQQKVEHLAYHDALTKLPNRLLLEDRLDRALALAVRNGAQVVVCYLDLDGFKPVNDLYGHKAGDIVLRHVAQCLEEGVRGHDTAARLGGDEFVLVLTEVHQQAEWYPVIERVTTAIAEPCDIGEGRRVTVTASVGVAIFPEQGNDPESLLHAADQALYCAKRSGRNRVCLATGMPEAG